MGVNMCEHMGSTWHLSWLKINVVTLHGRQAVWKLCASYYSWRGSASWYIMKYHDIIEINIYVCVYTHMCMYVYIYICIYIYMYVCMYACVHVCMYACMHVCMYACMHVCMFACMHVWMYACMHVFMYLCIYLFICIYIYIPLKWKLECLREFQIFLPLS